VNPPVHAWAAWRVYKIEKKRRGVGDYAFLERVFHKLLLNFTWWVNRKDPEGLNVFQGGFLGLDNIGVFDRSKPLPGGGYLEQSDGTSWMAMYSLNLMAIAMELAGKDHAYEDVASKFWEHWGEDFTVECPTGSGRTMTLWEVATELSRRLSALFLRGQHGRRPVFGSHEKFRQDPHWRDLLLFYEHFDGDTGAGVGASHQTGWTALVAKLLQQSGA
jgi:hypothetical protein